MSVLVTGAAGFLGRHIVQQALARDNHVRVFCRTPKASWAALFGLKSEHVEIAVGDIRDPLAVDAALNGMDTVFHVAGVAGLWGPWKHYFQVNVQGTQNVIAACRRHGVRRLVYTSSPSVVFTTADQCGDDESLPYTHRWLCHYSHSKALAEQAVLAANIEGDLRTCALRPHLIWGPGDRHLLPRLLASARSGRLRKVGNGQNLTDIAYVDNAAAAHLLAADALIPGSPVCGRSYFISQGEPVNCWQWIDELLALTGLPAVKKSISVTQAWRVGLMMETAYRVLRLRTEPPMTRFLAAQLGRSHWFDISAARRDFGYQPIVTTTDGMSRLKASFVSEPTYV
ncbi:MAG TPA: NAD-dependent epimerase/dehydratase family protein [Pirellulales bacterium]|nr:NAD-dependent epimerase/dehydratase family protein [Pirellulales bacterium]